MADKDVRTPSKDTDMQYTMYSVAADSWRISNEDVIRSDHLELPAAMIFSIDEGGPADRSKPKQYTSPSLSKDTLTAMDWARELDEIETINGGGSNSSNVTQNSRMTPFLFNKLDWDKACCWNLVADEQAVINDEFKGAHGASISEWDWVAVSSVDKQLWQNMSAHCPAG